VVADASEIVVSFGSDKELPGEISRFSIQNNPCEGSAATFKPKASSQTESPLMGKSTHNLRKGQEIRKFKQ